jgi:transcriptional regulator with PAS, ATPase and Fis domain/TPR repeat protein
MKKQEEILQLIAKIENAGNSPEICKKLTESASKQIDTIKDEIEKARFYYKLGKILGNSSEIAQSILYYKNALKIFETVGDKMNIIKCYFFIGHQYLKIDSFEAAKEYFTLALKASLEVGEMNIHSNSSQNLGRIYNELGNYDKALEMLFYSLKIYQSENDKQNIAEVLNKIAISFTEIGLYDRAIEHNLKAIEICEALNKKGVCAYTCNNIGITYQHSKNYEAALEYFFKSLKLGEEMNDLRLMTFVFNNIGEIYLSQKKFELALDYLLKAKKTVADTDKYALSTILFNLGKAYLKLGEPNKVFQYLDPAIALSEELNVLSIKMEIYAGAHEIYSELGEFEYAYDYLKKYYEIKESIINAESARKIEETQSGDINGLLHRETDSQDNDFPEIIGCSKEMKDLFSLMKTVANHNVNLMVIGPTGSGKELIAKAIHRRYQKNAPFIAINCSAIPEHLLESELFGYTKGAFTGAVKDKKGKIEMANNGTLFLDEIGDMPLSLQAKMLRVIQERKVTPVGSSKSVPVSFRIISATHRNLNNMIEASEFRQDLFYRLNVIKLEIPTLAKRKLDIPFLVKHFINKYNAKYGKKIKCSSADVMNYLLSLNWPGNVRELENAIEKAVLLCAEETLHIELFTDKTLLAAETASNKIPLQWLEYKSYRNKTINKMDVTYVNELLSSADNSVIEASKIGGLDRTQIYRLIKKKNIELKE